MSSLKTLKFVISLHDGSNDLIGRYTVDTEKEKDEIMTKHYHLNNEAKHCDVQTVETQTTWFNK